jgi:hypothetical protein
MFYFVAWRLLVVMRSTGDLAWPGLPSPDAPGVTLVRNHLIEHPEKHGRLFDRSATLIKDGPVLKSARMVIDPETGEAVSAPENVDRGLYVNARELHAALVQCLTPSTSGN